MSTQVANTILMQIRATDRWALAAWGVTFAGIQHTPVARESGVVLPCSGRIRVTVTYDEGADLYEVTAHKIATVRQIASGKPPCMELESVSMVYADSLVAVIDGMVKRHGK